MLFMQMPRKFLIPFARFEIVQTKQTHGRKHQNSVAGAEIAAVHCREKLEDDRAGPPQSHTFFVKRSEPEPLVDLAVRHEKDCGEENQERNQ